MTVFLFLWNYTRRLFLDLRSILEATSATPLEIEKRISEGGRVIGMLKLLSCGAKLSFTKPKNLCTRL
jgi:hypothetical protein